MAFATDLQNIINSVYDYLTSKSDNIPKWSTQYDILDIALKQLNRDNTVEFNKRVVNLFEEHESEINKLNYYFVEALRNKNYQLVLWLAKRNPTHECFLKDLNNMVKCEDNTNLEECIENILYKLFRTYIEIPSEEKNFDCMDLLLEIGVDINRYDNKGDTNLLITIEDRHYRKVEYLLSRGADPNIQNKSGNTPLMEIVAWCNNENTDVLNFVKLLFKYKADPNIRDQFGETVLFNVGKCKDIKIAKLLIEAGADVNVISNRGETPLKLASMYNNSALYNLLIENGAKVESTKPISKSDSFSDLQ